MSIDKVGEIMKNKNNLIPIIVFVVTFVLVFLLIYLRANHANKQKYSCYDYINNVEYTFATEEEMHEVCDKLNGDEEDQLLATYDIYHDILEIDDPDFSLYPYINSDKELTITIAISNCDTPEAAKAKAKKWFSNHNYNIKDYNIEYEYPCDVTNYEE